MGLFALPCIVLHHLVTYLYPLYASYKAISAKPKPLQRTLNGHETTEMAELEGWLMYWSVVGAMTMTETWIEWSWSWLPFYSFAKLGFTLWLVLPQTQGATLLYVHYLAPFLKAHESDIDVAMESAKRRAGQAAGRWIIVAWRRLREAIIGAAAPLDTLSNDEASHASSAPHPSARPAEGQWQRFLRTYGSSVTSAVVNTVDKAAMAAASAAAATAGGGGGSAAPYSRQSQLPSNDASDCSDGEELHHPAARSAEERMSHLSRQLTPSNGSELQNQSTFTGNLSDGSSLRKRPASRLDGAHDAQDLGGSYHLVDVEEPAQTVTSPQTSWTSLWSRR